MTGDHAPRRLAVAMVAAAALLWAVPASAQIGYTGSLYVVRIDTPDGDRTDAVYFFTSLDVEHGRLRGTLTVPVVTQRSRWTDPALGPIETGWDSGLADPTLRMDVEVWRSRWRGTSVRASGSVKLPVASVDDGYSSGEVDVALGLSVSTFRGRSSLLADATYWTLGDPTAIDYRNVPAFYLGYARVLDRGYRWSGIVSVSGAGSAVRGFDAPAQVSVALLRLLGAGAAAGVSLDIGLTDGAADVAVGSTWRFAF